MRKPISVGDSEEGDNHDVGGTMCGTAVGASEGLEGACDGTSCSRPDDGERVGASGISVGEWEGLGVGRVDGVEGVAVGVGVALGIDVGEVGEPTKIRVGADVGSVVGNIDGGSVLYR